MENIQLEYLKKQAQHIRKLIIQSIYEVGQGHLGGCLSIVEVLTVLYFHEMNIVSENPTFPGRDRFVLSKGHAGPALYATLALKGFFHEDDLMTLNKPGTQFPSHCDMTRTPGIDMTTGSLGQGVSCAVGIAKAAKLLGGTEYIYSIIGDGESQEGLVWEASMAAAHFKLDNLILFLDYNKLQIDGTIEDIMSLGNPIEKWKSFGFNTFRVNGHNMEMIIKAIKNAKQLNDGRPTMIILDTVKGKGVSFIEAKGVDSHSMIIDKEQTEAAMVDIFQG